jgi:hypothetical protein
LKEKRGCWLVAKKKQTYEKVLQVLQIFEYAYERMIED